MALSAQQPAQVTHGSFTIEKIYAHPAARVFDAFASKAKKTRWFVEGEGFETVSFEMDFRVGGRERSQFRVLSDSPVKGEVITNETVYLDIVPDQRIVVAYTMGMGENRFSASMLTIELLPGRDSGSTKLVLTEQGAYFTGADGVQLREAGTRELLEALGRELARNE